MTNLNALSKDQLIALLNAANKPRALSMKVSAKGAISVYGLGRFPVTLYAGQWERLIAASADITAFATATATLLATTDAVAT